MADVFISYSRRVKEPTIALAGELVGLGYDVVYDVDLLPNDPKFEAVINGWIDEAGATITIWSEPALKSRWVPYEAKRAQGLNRLLNTHVEDFDPAKLPADFHGMHCSCVVECDTIYAALVEMQVRPAGKTEADLPPRAVLKRHAQEEWLNEVKDSTDPIRIERFIEDYRRLAMFREIAQDRLKRIAGRADARISPRATILRKPTDAELTALTVAWPGIQDTADPADIDDLLKDFGGIDHFFVRQAIRRLDQLRDSTPTKETTTDELAVSEAATLRLAPAMHTALIRRISLAADGALMASASHDKTVKLWALPEGRLVRTLRPPVGEGDEGKAYAVAIDPAGRWVAAGGWMKTGLDEYVTLFDSETGAVRARLGPLPHRVRDLEVSTDGARLAAGLGGANGIRLWEMAGWQPIGEDTDYGGDVYGLAFAADGRLASTSYDGHVRLYGPDGEMLAKARAPGGARPYGIAFDPGGARLAVGYGDSLLVDVLDAASLQPLYSADTAGLSGGNFFSVAWLGGAGAGLRLAAGGRSGGHRSERLFTWDEAGRGARQPWPGPANTITDLARTPDGGLALAGAEPSLAVYTPEGARRLNKPPEIADLRNKLGEHFTVSADGRRLRFGLEEWSDTPALFDLAALSLTDAPAPVPGLAAPDTGSLAITGWINTTAPTLIRKTGPGAGDTTPLALKPYEIARSLAIAPDANSFVLGAEYRLRRFDATGAQLWQRPVPGPCWGVNLAREGRLILAAYGDGTIRWHRASDGEELLALFIHLPQGPKDTPSENRDWILWTPEGYYTASSDRAEDLIGWHVNRGDGEAADFYPAETFAETFRRPDKIAAALDGV